MREDEEENVEKWRRPTMRKWEIKQKKKKKGRWWSWVRVEI